MSVLSIQGVSKHFGSFTVLDGIDMELEKGKDNDVWGQNDFDYYSKTIDSRLEFMQTLK